MGHQPKVDLVDTGALLSAHHMLMTNESILPGYDGSLLRFGVDLADRLLPAFDTPYGVPLSWINLKKVSRAPPMRQYLQGSNERHRGRSSLKNHEQRLLDPACTIHHMEGAQHLVHEGIRERQPTSPV